MNPRDKDLIRLLLLAAALWLLATWLTATWPVK